MFLHLISITQSQIVIFDFSDNLSQTNSIGSLTILVEKFRTLVKFISKKFDFI